ncbi:MAG TPA: hypothetical protein VJH34_04050 [archaeon]|nr:hypothetical protein [archaeon]
MKMNSYMLYNIGLNLVSTQEKYEDIKTTTLKLKRYVVSEDAVNGFRVTYQEELHQMPFSTIHNYCHRLIVELDNTVVFSAYKSVRVPNPEYFEKFKEVLKVENQMGINKNKPLEQLFHEAPIQTEKYVDGKGRKLKATFLSNWENKFEDFVSNHYKKLGTSQPT